MATQSPFAAKSGSIGGLLLPAAAILGSVAAYGFFSGAFTKHSHAKLEILEAKPAKPTKSSKSSPLITKIESVPIAEVPEKIEPTLEPKSLAVPEALEALAEVVETSEVVAPEAMEVPQVPEVPSQTESVKAGSAEETFEQYRQAMLTTGPRDLEHQARVEMQTKGGMANNAMWRAQTASLRKSLENDDPALFLERSNISVNDRVLSSFHASKEA
jgi:hypothetical protein